MTLTEFLLARIEDDEQWCRVIGAAAERVKDDPRAQAMLSDSDLMPTLLAMLGEPGVMRLMTDRTESGVKPPNDLAQMLAECEAKRRIVENHSDPDPDDGPEEGSEAPDCPDCWQPQPCLTKCLLALPYADHPEFQDSWRVDAEG